MLQYLHGTRSIIYIIKFYDPFHKIGIENKLPILLYRVVINIDMLFFSIYSWIWRLIIDLARPISKWPYSSRMTCSRLTLLVQIQNDMNSIEIKPKTIITWNHLNLKPPKISKTTQNRLAWTQLTRTWNDLDPNNPSIQMMNMNMIRLNINSSILLQLVVHRKVRSWGGCVQVSNQSSIQEWYLICESTI